jgi:hypothetical protein
MALLDQESDVRVQEVSAKEGREIVDRAARRHLNMSGEEFLKAWDAGAFDDDPDRPEVMSVAMLLPFAR